MRLRNIGWLVCAGTNLTELPISLRFSSVAPLSPSFLSSAFLMLFLTPPPPPCGSLQGSLLLRVSLSLSFFLCFLSLLSHLYRSTFRLLSLLSQPSFSFSPTRREEEPRALYTRAHVLTYIRLQGFCSWRPILSDNEDDPFSSRVEREPGKCGWRRRYDFTQLLWPRHFFPYLGITSKLE